MPRFYFNVFDSRLVLDTDSVELSDVDKAREEAIRISGKMIARDAELIATGDAWAMEVTDQLGQRLFRLRLSVNMG